MTEAEEQEYQKLLELDVAGSLMEDFVQYTFPQYQPNWHHRLICSILNRFIFTNEIPRLMIFTPPRMGKSELVSRRLPAFIFGQNPDAKIISCSYSSDLSSMFNRDVQKIIDQSSYQDLFPQVKLNSSNARTTGRFLRNSDIFQIVGSRGEYRSAGVGGGITGMGCDYLIIDDPIKNSEEADSPTVRQKIWDWYTTTAYTRLEKNAKVILMMTRWHEDDLAGRLLKQMKEKKEADQWHVVSLPALAEPPLEKEDPRQPGEPLWPGKYSLERMKAIRAGIGPRAWNSLFQQRPHTAGGQLLKRVNWRFYGWNNLPEKFDVIIQSWDMSFKDKVTSDYVAGQVWGRVGQQLYLLDYFKERLSFSESVKAVRQMTARWPKARIKLIEDKANGTAIIDHLKNEIPGLTAVNPQGGKVARVNAMSPVHEAQNIWIPLPENLPWVQGFIETCANFPNVTHDDDVDAMSQAVLYLSGDPRKKLMDLLRD